MLDELEGLCFRDKGNKAFKAVLSKDHKAQFTL